MPSAIPMEASSNALPLCRSTVAPFFKQRDASGMSAVMQMSAPVICAAIQSSAASAPSGTITVFISGF